MNEPVAAKEREEERSLDSGRGIASSEEGEEIACTCVQRLSRTHYLARSPVISLKKIRTSFVSEHVADGGGEGADIVGSGHELVSVALQDDHPRHLLGYLHRQ